MNKLKLIPILLIIFSICTSCKPLLLNTIGRKLYKKKFMQSQVDLKRNSHQIPFQIVEGQIILKVTINNNDYNFLFDTGSDSFLSNHVVKELGIAPQMEVVRLDFNSQRVESNLYILNNASIGNLTIKNWSVLSMDFSSLNASQCVNIDGIIGRNVLNWGTFHFAHESKTLTISNVNEADERKVVAKIRIKINWDGNIIARGVHINRINTSFLFDTGYDGFFKLADAKDLTLIKKRHQFNQALVSSKLMTIPFYKVDKLKIKQLQFDSARVVGYGSSTTSPTNLMGNYLFRMADITIDRKHKRLYLSNVTHSPPNLIANISIGWSPDRQEYYISALTVGSKLEKLGIHFTDNVSAINDVEASSFSDYCSFKSFIDKIDINKIDMKLSILRNGEKYIYVVDKELMYE